MKDRRDQEVKAKPAAKPSRPRASMRAAPMNMLVRSAPATSGWRAVPSCVLPTTMPMPMPGPIAARP